MKKVSNGKVGMMAVCFILVSLLSCNSRTEEHTASGTKYTCPMHSQIVADEPGTCPICHMDLVPANSKASDAPVSTDLADLIKPSNELVLSQIRTVKPEEGVRTSGVEVQGIINYNMNNWRTISSRAGGRVEKLYIKYKYQYVKKGQKLMDICSPDLAGAQQELLYLVDAGDKSLIEAAKNKLRVLGASDTQISSVIRTRKIDYTFSIYSPYSGYVAEQTTSATNVPVSSNGATVINEEASGGGMNGMNNQQSPSSSQVPQVESSSPLQIREGQYIGQGQTLFRLINANSVWAEFFAGANQLNYLKRGTSVQVTSIDNKEQKEITKISLVQPYYSEGNTFSLLKAQINNSGMQWRIGQLVTVRTDAASEFGTWLPRTAVLHLGTRYVVFVKKGGSFEPEYVSVGQKAGDWVDIENSLTKDTEVAVNAWFMVDSESFVKVDSLEE